jgi:hypothetical protein
VRSPETRTSEARKRCPPSTDNAFLRATIREQPEFPAGTAIRGNVVRRESRPDRRPLPRWATAAVVIYLAVTAAVVAVALLTSALNLGLDQMWLLRGLMLLTLPVSAAYLVVGILLDLPRPPWPQEFSFGGLRPTALLYYLGYLALAVVNAAVFRRIVLSTRKGKPVPAKADLAEVRPRGVNHNAKNLLWALPLAVLLSLPQWLVAGLAWCGISGCSGGGFGVSRGSEWVAVILSVVNGFIFAVAVFAVRWLYPARKRALIAVAAGTLFGLVGAAVTHG